MGYHLINSLRLFVCHLDDSIIIKCNSAIESVRFTRSHFELLTEAVHSSASFARKALKRYWMSLAKVMLNHFLTVVKLSIADGTPKGVE